MADTIYRVAVESLSARPHPIPYGAIVNGLLPDDVLEACIARGEVVADSGELGNLDSLTRDELNERAKTAGVDDPEKLANKGEVADAIRNAEPGAPAAEE